MSTGPQITPQRILVVKLADLGDALATTPALGALRQGLPAATIHLLTTPAGEQALRTLSLYDDLIIFPKHRFDSPPALLKPANLLAGLLLWQRLAYGHYDTVLLLHHLTTGFGTLKYRLLARATGAQHILGLDNGRGNFLTAAVPDLGFGRKHESDYWLAVVGLLQIATAAMPLLGPPPVGAVLPAHAERYQVALHPGSGTFAPARRWPVARWAALADRLLADSIAVVLVGGPEEAELRRTFLSLLHQPQALRDWGGRTTFAELGGLLRQCDLFLGNDSGILHLAAAVGTPVVAPYGPTDPHAWGPWSEQPWTTVATKPNGVVVLQAGPHITLRATIACSPCIYRGYTLGTPAGCPDRTCLERITVAQMYEVVHARLSQVAGSVCA
ncbi:MAG: glycosyltransferase family 9 protein [Herpetosiphonaceae bacterium]|nr:glycosyltransferase family 9 protein [Herpetosiphonaceae bacterium]